MIDAGMSQDNFMLPAPPVGGLPISQDWLDRMKLEQLSQMPHNEMDDPLKSEILGALGGSTNFSALLRSPNSYDLIYCGKSQTILAKKPTNHIFTAITNRNCLTSFSLSFFLYVLGVFFHPY